MNKHTFLAFDLGATSGRSIIATYEAGKLEMRELTRFPNHIMELHGKYYWDIFSLYSALKEGLRKCAEEGITPDSMGIDTWGVDFAYIAEDGTLLSLPRAYRDPYTEGVPEELFEKVPREEVYQRTGIQIMNFNSIYQLFAAAKEAFSPFNSAKEILFMPDALAYLLTGNKVCEYTIASTSQMLNPRTQQFDKELLKLVGIRSSLLTDPIMPGNIIGELTDAIAEETGINKIKVVAVAGHDTASAVAAVPAKNKHFAYLSSGTWSLMGIETPEPIITETTFKMNFTNEGGVAGTTRFLKNICGMWILEQCRREWKKEGKSYTYPQIVEMATIATPFVSLINPDDASFANPSSMLMAIDRYCKKTNQEIPANDAQYIRTIFESLALRYREVMEMLESVSPFPIEVLHVIGGGSQNNLLNQFTANALGKEVISGPSEATALGNILIQAMAMEVITSLQELRNVVENNSNTEHFFPQEKNEWDIAYKQFLFISKL